MLARQITVKVLLGVVVSLIAWALSGPERHCRDHACPIEQRHVHACVNAAPWVIFLDSDTQ